MDIKRRDVLKGVGTVAAAAAVGAPVVETAVHVSVEGL